MAARAVIGVDVDNLAAGVEGAAIKRHGRRAVCPDGVVAVWGVEGRVLELGGLVAPVERLAVDDAAVEHGLVGANEAEVVGTAGTHRHVPERNGTGTVKRIVAIILGAIVCRIGHNCTDVPCGLVRAQTLKGKVLALGETLRLLAVEGVVALAELNGVAALRRGGSGLNIIVGHTGGFTVVFNGDRYGSNRSGNVVCKSRRCNAHRDERNGKQRCGRTRGRFQKRLHAETPSSPKV